VRDLALPVVVSIQPRTRVLLVPDPSSPVGAVTARSHRRSLTSAGPMLGSHARVNGWCRSEYTGGVSITLTGWWRCRAARQPR